MVVTRVTLAPRLAASSATAWPCLPEDRLPMKRTGSIGSRVPPAVTTTRSPVRSCSCSAVRSPSMAATIVLGLGQAAGADVAAGQAAGLGLDDVHATGAQQAQVVLHRRVLPHLGVHGRAHEHRRPGGEQHVGEQVVADPAGVEAEHAGGGRGHHARGRRSARGGCAGSGAARPRATSTPARSRGRRRWCGRRSGARPR